MSNANGTTRRGALAGAGALGVAALAGCFGGGSASTGEGDYGGWLSDAPNYEGTTTDRTGESEVTVTVGGGDGFTFDPAAVAVDAGTTVTWEWTGRGNRHNVVEKGGGYGSERTAEEGATFAHAFETAGVSKYYCTPHRNLGMKGVVEVSEG